ncbi:MAG TPA: undecaprenyl-diphosphate phosphatase [Acidimicrobiia bacterium]
MLTALVWGLVQGLTEFLPVSSSGHLVVVPAFLSRLGMEIAEPDLAISAVLHLGTLTSVLIYFREDIARMLRFRTDPDGRRVLLLLVIGTIPAISGLFLEGPLDRFQDTVANVGWALIATGVILLIGQRFARGVRRLEEGNIPDAIVVGLAQALALIPGISRSGSTITAGNVRGFDPREAARFSFLLGIPTIAGAGLLQIPELADAGRLDGPLAVGFLAAAISGYLAISFLLSVIRKVGLIPFAGYALVVGALTVIFL